jgi:hypothetical protein
VSVFICGFLPRKNVSFSTKVAHALFFRRERKKTQTEEKKREILSSFSHSQLYALAKK